MQKTKLNVSQTKIIEKIGAYLKIKYKTQFECNGLCGGFSYMYVFCRYVQSIAKTYGITSPTNINRVIILKDKQPLSSIELSANSNALVITNIKNIPHNAYSVYLIENNDTKPATTVTTGGKITTQSFEIEASSIIDSYLNSTENEITDQNVIKKIASLCTKQREDYDWLKYSIDKIIQWNGEENTLDEELTKIFETFINYIFLFQNGLQGTMKIISNNNESLSEPIKLFNEIVKNVSSISIPNISTKTQITMLLQFPNLIREGDLIYIISNPIDFRLLDDRHNKINNKEYHGHAVGLIKLQGEFFYFDPNSTTGEFQSCSENDIAEKLFKVFALFNGTRLELEIFSNKTNKDPYPTNDEINENISIFKVISNNNNKNLDSILGDNDIAINRPEIIGIFDEPIGPTPIIKAIFSKNLYAVKQILKKPNIKIKFDINYSYKSIAINIDILEEILSYAIKNIDRCDLSELMKNISSNEEYSEAAKNQKITVLLKEIDDILSLRIIRDRDDVTKRNEKGISPLDDAIISDNLLKITDLLQDPNVDINKDLISSSKTKANINTTPIVTAVRFKKVKVLKKLLEYSLNFDREKLKGVFDSINYCKKNYGQIYSEIIKNERNEEDEGNKGSAFLFSLIEAYENNSNLQLLVQAIMQNDSQKIRKLLQDSNIDISKNYLQQPNTNFTLIGFAISCGKVEALRELLNYSLTLDETKLLHIDTEIFNYNTMYSKQFLEILEDPIINKLISQIHKTCISIKAKIRNDEKKHSEWY